MTGSRFAPETLRDSATTPPDPSAPQYDTSNVYGDREPVGAIRQYGQDFPAPVSDPLNHIRTAGYNPGSNRGDWPEQSASFRYITPSEGGQAGTVGERSGYTSGLAKLDRNIHHFTGRAVRFVRADESKNTGPVGKGIQSYSEKLTAGVGQQVQTWPSLSEIAQALVQGR